MSDDLSYIHPDMINPSLDATTILLDPDDPGKGSLGDVITALQGAIRTKADLTDAGGMVVEAQLPPLGETSTITRDDAPSMYGADLQGGDLCVRTDESNSLYILLRRPASTPENWQKIWSPQGGVGPGVSSWMSLSDTPSIISPYLVVKGNSTGTALTQGPVKTSEIVNDSTSTGTTLKDVLDSLGSSSGSGVSQTDLTNALAGKADASHTHNASELNNDSTVTGTKISDALNSLKTDLDAVPDSSAVTSQINTALAGKADQADLTSLQNALAGKADSNHSHNASELNNDSNVSGSTIRDALNNLQNVATSGMTPQGAYNASSNSPALSSGSGNDGDLYWVTTAGSLSPAIDGITDLDVGDIIFAANGAWHRVGRTDEVTSVFGRKGAVSAQSGDYDASQIDNDSNITGATVQDALNNLKTDLDAVPAIANPVVMTDSLANGGYVADLPSQKVTSSDYLIVGGASQNATGTYALTHQTLQRIQLTGNVAISMGTTAFNHLPTVWHATTQSASTLYDGTGTTPVSISRIITLIIDNSGGHTITWSAATGIDLVAPGGTVPDITGKARISIQLIEEKSGNKQAIITQIDDDLQTVT